MMAMDARASGTTAAPVTGRELPPPPAAGPGAPGLPAPGAAGCVDDDVGSLGLDELDVG